MLAEQLIAGNRVLTPKYPEGVLLVGPSIGPYAAAGSLGRLGLRTAILLLALSLRAFAGLGGDESSIQADQAQMHASRRTTAAAAYTVHELQAPTGHLVREYVSPSGTVFGVAWQGPTKPDLRQLLGSHFDELKPAAPAARVRRGPVVIHQPGLVFEMGGHVRAFAGRAYIPEQVPAGVLADAIR